MRRPQQFPDETGRVGHILFWLFPNEGDTLGRRRTPTGRAPHTPPRKEQFTRVVAVRDRVRSVSKSGHGWMLVITSLLLLGSPVNSSHAQGANPNRQYSSTDCVEWGRGSTESQVVGLDPRESIKLSCLLGLDGLSRKVGANVSGNSSHKLKDTGCGIQGDLKPASLSLTALGSNAGPGAAFTETSAATGESGRNRTGTFSITEAGLNDVIADVHLANSGSTYGKGFSSVVEKVFTGKSRDVKVGQLEGLKTVDPIPVFQDLAHSTSEALQVPTLTTTLSSISPGLLPRP